jgi:hypothetical protein
MKRHPTSQPKKIKGKIMNDSDEQNSNKKADSSKCPFNNFESCIGNECAFFLDHYTLNMNTNTNTELKGNLLSLISCHPCAITINGFASTLNLLNLSLLPQDK